MVSLHHAYLTETGNTALPNTLLTRINLQQSQNGSFLECCSAICVKGDLGTALLPVSIGSA